VAFRESGTVIHDSGLTYLLWDKVFTWSIPVLHKSVMVRGHVVCLWKNTIRMCNKKCIIWYPNNCLVRIIIYIWLNIDILRINTVLD